MADLYDNKHFIYHLKNILIIRSYSPLLDTAIRLLREDLENEFTVEILKVKGSASHPAEHYPEVKKIYETPSPRGFSMLYLPQHYKMFEGKHYDTVFILYGVSEGKSRYFNVDAYAYGLDCRYKVGLSPDGRLYVLTDKRFIRKCVWFAFSRISVAVNVAASVGILMYGLLLLVLFSPLALFYRPVKSNN